MIDLCRQSGVRSSDCFGRAPRWGAEILAIRHQFNILRRKSPKRKQYIIKYSAPLEQRISLEDNADVIVGTGNLFFLDRNPAGTDG
jgi:hypothetical protein